jgi:hypothetical protein
MIGYLSDERSMERLFEEVAYLAYYFHWPYEQIMGLEHRERQQWVAEVARINRRINEDAASARGG